MANSGGSVAPQSGGREDIVQRVGSLPSLAEFFATFFAEAPLPLQIYKLDGYSLVTNAAFRELFGTDTPPGYNIFKDEIVRQRGLEEFVQRAFAGEVVESPPLWYDPRDLEHVEISDANRVAISATFFPLHDADGKIEFIGALYRERTDELLTRRSLEIEAAGLELAQKAAGLGNWELDLSNLDDLNSNPLKWSDEAYRIFGYAPQEVDASNELFFELVHPADRETVREAVAEALAKGQDYSVEHRINLPSGEQRWVLEQSIFDRGSDGKPTKMIGTVLDITERKQIEEMLRETEQNLRKIMDLIPHAIYCKDATGKLLFANRGFSKVIGIPADTFNRLQQADWCETEDQASKYLEEDREVIETGVPKFIPYELFRDKQGRSHILQTTKVPFAVAGTKEVAVLGISIEITELKNIQDKLEEQNALFSGMMESTDEPIFAVDRSGACTQYNSAFAGLVRRANGPSAQISTGSIQFFQREEDRSRFVPWIQRALSGERFVEEFFFQAVDAWFEVSLNPIRSQGGTVVGVAVFMKNVTAKRAALQAIRELNLDLEQRVETRTAELAHANRELESFAYSISHDLRSPLRAIDGFSDILFTEYGSRLDEEGHEHLSRVRKASQRMAELIDGLLAFSRLGRQAMLCKRISTAQIVGETLDELSALARGRDIEFKVGHLPPCSADRTLIRTVFSNLIENAIKFTSTKKTAVVEIGSMDRNGQTVWFVRDNGVGFDMKYSGQLFGVFQRLHRPDEFEGTGVGLALVQRIVSRHGGEIWAESAPDQGACFYFTLGHGMEVEFGERSARDLAG